MDLRTLRRAWLQAHRWIGVSLAILIIPLALSGSALVWPQALDRLLNPGRYAVSGQALLPPQRYAAAAAAVLKPDERIASLALPDGAGPVVVAAAKTGARPHAGPPPRVLVYLDPPTARVLAVADSGRGALRFVHMLHGSLMLPGVGRSIVGWIGVAMMVSSLTGLWLWWPLGGSVARGLRWRRRGNVPADLHHLVGFWVALPLFVLSLTGALIAFPALLGGGGGGHERGSGFRAPPVAATRLTLDGVAALAAARGTTRLREIDWPTAADPRWTLLPQRRGPALSIDDADGSVTTAPQRPHGRSGLAGTIRRLHDGDAMGAVWQAILFATGLIPSILAVTGIIIWWRARTWRAHRAARRRPNA